MRQIRKGLTRKKEIVQVILKQKIGYVGDSKETRSLGTKKECVAICRLLRQRLKMLLWKPGDTITQKKLKQWQVSLMGAGAVEEKQSLLEMPPKAELESLFSHPLVSH